MDNLLKTQLYEIHASSGARMVPFAGWEMPIQYSSIINECNAVRNKAGIFDVSHMGRFMITGKDASLALDKIFLFNHTAPSAVFPIFSPVAKVINGVVKPKA